MKKSLTLTLFAIGALAFAAAAQACGVPVADTVQHFVAAHPDIALGLSGLGVAGTTAYVQDGDVLNLAPGADVPSGTGYLFGAALFGVAAVDAKNGIASAFVCEGVVKIAKTAALAINVGDRVFWDPVNKVVNKTVAAQQQVGICVVNALAADATVTILLESAVPVAT
jgi:predicted RecA/RadA family phage recombinase